MMSKKLVLVLSLTMAVLPLAANALGLGEIKLNSALNDKFSADIQVVGATSDELDSLEVQLASFKQFSQAGLDHPEVLSQLQFVVVRNPDGTAYIHISSSQPVREPFLDFLLDANWNNGELIREYTVLLNPPNFETATAAKSQTAAVQPAAQPAAPAPAMPAATTPQPAIAEAAKPAPAQPIAPEATQTPPAPQPAASPPPVPTPLATPAPAQRALGANYGPIHRGETLSEIASGLRPQGVTLNQMMIAIYRENPEVFMQNINRMKAGYILRVPNLSDIQAVSVADANAEVRAQIDAWRTNRGEAVAQTPSASSQPALQLVAPTSAAESSAPVPGAAASGTGGTATSQTGTPAQGTEQATTPVPPLPSPSQAPLNVNSNSMATVQQQAASAASAVAPPPVVAPAQPAQQPKTATPKTVETSGGFLDTVMNPYVLGALAAVFIVIVVGVAAKKRKQKSKSGSMSGGAGIKGASWLKQEQAGGEDDVTVAASSTTRTKAKKAKAAVPEPATEVAAQAEESSEDKTMLMSSPPPAPAAETMVGGATSQVDVSDPISESDFHMAYGLYDQAADVLRKALRQDPGRRDVQMKLLEVFFTAGDRASFVDEAKKMRASMGVSPDKDWDSVAIMGRQVAPDEPMFTGEAGSGGAGVDIALDAGGTSTVVSDLDPLAGAFTGLETSAPSPVPASAPAPAPAATDDNSLDFSLPDIEPVPAAPAVHAPEPAPAGGDGGLEFDIGDMNIEPAPAAARKAEPKTVSADEPTVATDFGTDSQVEFDKALNDLASFVNTNVPVQAETASDIEIPAVSADMSETPSLDQESTGTGSNEVGTKLDLARAYIDMGDPDGAKNILEEVLAEGNAQQKQEAQDLMKHIG